MKPSPGRRRCGRAVPVFSIWGRAFALAAREWVNIRVHFMVAAEIVTGDWDRDLPDHRDYTPAHSSVRKLLSRLAARKGKRTEPTSVDWREYFPRVQDQRPLATSCAHACVGLMQYFERRATGVLLEPSRLFLHYNSRRLFGTSGGAGLRNTLKSAVRFGLPPERQWPYEPSAVDRVPDAHLYAYAGDFRRVRYVRLDAAGQTGRENLEMLKSFLAAGFVCALGLGVPSSLTNDPEIPFPTRYDSICAGHAVTVVGYDDALRIRSERGALLIRNSWGRGWGMDGFGWMPYRYVTDRLAADIWTVTRPKWIRSGEFQRPG